MLIKLRDAQKCISKVAVKSSLKDANLKATPYGAFDQYPKVVQERRKELIPIMIEARKKGQSAYLARDKLFINNKPYEPL